MDKNKPDKTILESALRQLILKEHSKRQRDEIIKWVSADQQRFDLLIKLFLSKDKLISQRAAWPISHIAIAHPALVKKHLGKIIDQLQEPNLHPAIKRNTLRLLEEIMVPESMQGKLMDSCFRYLEDPKETIAVKAFALTNLYNLSLQYPEILPEIKTLIETQRGHFSPGLIVRARPFLK